MSSDPPTTQSAGPPGLKTRLQPENWSLLVKLSAVLLVPILLALTLGGLRIGDQIGRAKELAGLDRHLDVQAKSGSLLVALQRERAAAAVVSAGKPGAGTPVQSGALTDAVKSVDGAWNALRDSTGDPGTLGAGPSDLYQQVEKAMGKLEGLRDQVRPTGRPSVPAATVITNYSAVIQPVLAFQGAVDGRLDIAALGGLSGELTELSAIREQVTSEHAIIAAALAAGAPAPSDADAVRSADVRLNAAIDEFRAGLDSDRRQRYAGFVDGPAMTHFNQLKLAAISRPPAGHGPGVPVTPMAWDDANRGLLAELNTSERGISDEIAATSSASQGKYRNQAGIDSVLLLLALLAAATVVFLVGRSMLRPLRVLRSTALDVAERRLPRVLEVMRAGQVPEAHVERVPVNSIEEIGQVARAFDEVHGQAIALANEQATLQVNIRNMFVNLSRRSQTLVERQLQLIERLERNEQDPEQLDNLFQLDHLATRMRRNSENLLVLAGSELAKRGSAQVPIVDVLRAAASEIENYQRVVVQPPPSLAIQGRAANDIVHLVAELLDNATSYSPPDTQVVISSSRASDGSLLVEIADRGVGMSQERLAEFNQRLAGHDDMDVSASRRMGLFVVGRLAARHGVTVRLASGGNSTGTVGVTASVTVPEQLTAATKSDQVGTGASGTRRAEVEDSAPRQANATNGAASRMFAPANNGSLPTRRPGRPPGAVGPDTRGGGTRPGGDGRPAPAGRPAGPKQGRPGGSPPGSPPSNGTGPNGAGPDGPRPNGVAPAASKNGTGEPTGITPWEDPSPNGVSPAAAAAGAAATTAAKPGSDQAKPGSGQAKPGSDQAEGRDENTRGERERGEPKPDEPPRGELTSAPVIPPVTERGTPRLPEGSAATDEQEQSSRPAPPTQTPGPVRPVGQPPAGQSRPPAQAPGAAQPPGARPSGSPRQPGQAPAARQAPRGQQPPPSGRPVPPARKGQPSGPGPRGGQPAGPGQPSGARGGQPGQPGDQPAARQARPMPPARPDQQRPIESSQPVGQGRSEGQARPAGPGQPPRPEQGPRSEPATLSEQPSRSEQAERSERPSGPKQARRAEQAPPVDQARRPESPQRPDEEPGAEQAERPEQPARPERAVRPVGQAGAESPQRPEEAQHPDEARRPEQRGQGPRTGQGPARGPAPARPARPMGQPPSERPAPPPRRSVADRRAGRGLTPDESPIFEETSAWFRDNWMVGPGGSAEDGQPARRDRRAPAQGAASESSTEAVPPVGPRRPGRESETVALGRTSRPRTGLPGQVTRASTASGTSAEDSTAVTPETNAGAAPSAEEDRADWNEQEAPLRAMEQPDAGELTAAGLPKRTPRAQLIPDLPGGSEQSRSGAPAARSADQVRGRLSSYQSGIRQGRETRARRTSEPASASGDGNTKENA